MYYVYYIYIIYILYNINILYVGGTGKDSGDRHPKVGNGLSLSIKHLLFIYIILFIHLFCIVFISI